MAADFSDAAMIDDHDAVGVANGGEPMSGSYPKVTRSKRMLPLSASTSMAFGGIHDIRPRVDQLQETFESRYSLGIQLDDRIDFLQRSKKDVHQQEKGDKSSRRELALDHKV